MAGYVETARYSPEEAMRYLSGLAAWWRVAQSPEGTAFAEGGPIERAGQSGEGPFAAAARAFADVLSALEELPEVERWPCLGVWRDGAKVDQVARKLRRRESAVWAAFYSGTEEALYALTRESGMKTYFKLWRERRHNRRLQDGI